MSKRLFWDLVDFLALLKYCRFFGITEILSISASKYIALRTLSGHYIRLATISDLNIIE